MPEFPMNLTLDQYIDGLERSAHELPTVLADWSDLDPELCEEYAAQLRWLLRVRADVLSQAPSDRYLELVQRIAVATASIFELRDAIAANMGIPTGQIVGGDVNA